MAVTRASAKSLKNITNPYDSCTYYKENDATNIYGCYRYRSCQSCLETRGCMVNDLGICVRQEGGSMMNLETGNYSTNNWFNASRPENSYLRAFDQKLALPKALTTNRDALATEQNWFFRADEATYCKHDDAVCQECKTNHFWRGNDTSQLSDSRFCVGENNCVCIQTCEVPTFQAQGCQWKLPPPHIVYSYDITETHVASWEWLILVLVVVIMNLLCWCTQSKPTDTVVIKSERAFIEVQELQAGQSIA